MIGNVTCWPMGADEQTKNGIQFSIGVARMKCLDFGDSVRYQGQSVNEIIRRHLPYSATLGVLAYILALIVGLTAGIIAALKQNSAFDYASMAFAMLGLSVPNFVVGPVLVLVFALGLYLFPPARWGGFSSIVLPVVIFYRFNWEPVKLC